MNKQLLRFVIIGIFSTVVNYCIFFGLYKFLSVNYIVASSIGFLAGVFAGYNFNKIWTFDIKAKSNIYIIKYYTVYIASLFFGLALLKIMVSLAQISPEIANIIVIVFTTCTNFCGTKLWVFKK